MAPVVFPWGPLGGRPAVVPADARVPYPVAQTWPRREFLWWRPCKVCGCVRLMKARDRSCGRACGRVQATYTKERAGWNAAKWMAVCRKKSIVARRQRQAERVAPLVANLTPTQAYLKGYRNGLQQRRKVERRRVAA